MEMNTRIQVEHRVTELCYGLRFTNPEDANDYFETESLVEAMALVAAFGKKLPKPTRFLRQPASVEARLNATNEALQPHAGGIVKKWSNPVEGEVRDDQGISLRNPDTDMFMQYRLAGAYDSNIALLLTVGNDRLSTYQNMAETIRRTHMQGTDLKTNLEFHYGLVNWFIGNGINARPTTRFIVPYLTAVGELKQEANQIDLDYAFNSIMKKAVAGASDDAAKATQSAIERKRSLLLRPIENLFADAHVLAGWLSLHKDHFTLVDGHFAWTENPIKVLADTYHYLNMEANERAAPARVIWSHDEVILSAAVEFYAQLEAMLDTSDFAKLESLLAGSAPKGFDESRWAQVQASHAGFQLGMEVLDLLPYTACQVWDMHLQRKLKTILQ
jgi:hypothetical protein